MVRTELKKYKPLLKWLFIIVVLVLIARFVSQVDYVQLMEYLHQMPGTLALILFLSFMAYLTAAMAWQLCLGSAGNHISLYRLLLIRHVGETISIFNPTSIVAGEAYKSNSLVRLGVSQSAAVSSVLLSRMLIMVSAFVIIMCSVMYLIARYTFVSNGTVVIVMGIGVMVAMSISLSRLLLHRSLVLGRWAEKLHKKYRWSFVTQDVVDKIYDINRMASASYQDSKIKLLGAFLLSVVQWLFGAAEFYVILRGVGLTTSCFDAVAVEMGVLIFKSLGAVIPGQLGIEEYGNKIMFDVIGVTSNEIWLTASVLRRARQLFWLAGAGVMYWIVTRYIIKKKC